MKNNTTKVLSLQEMARMQKELEEKAGKLMVEVSKRAAAEKVPPEEIWIHLRLYRQKLYSTDNPKPKVVMPLSDIVDGVIEDIRKRSE